MVINGSVVNSKNSELIEIKNLLKDENIICFDGKDIISDVITDINTNILKQKYSIGTSNFYSYSLNDYDLKFTHDTIFITNVGFASINPSKNVDELKVGMFINKNLEWVLVEKINKHEEDKKTKYYNIETEKKSIFIINDILIKN